VLILGRSEIARVLDMNEVIEAVERGHADLSGGQGAELPPSQLVVPSASSLVIPMVATASGGVGGSKLLMDTPGNAKRSMPTQQSTIVLTDTDNGTCTAFLDGGLITRYRTAAASAIATKHLARPDAAVLGFVGAGALARTHVLAISMVREIREVVIWSRTARTAAAFAEHVQEMDLPARVLSSPDDVVRAADIVCTLTPSCTPLVHGRSFHPGLHVNAVGAPPRSDHREIDTEGMLRSRIVVDDFRFACRKSGNVCLPIAEGAMTEAHLSAELGQVIRRTRPGRIGADEITLYNSVGLATQDIVTARLVVDKARRQGLGHDVDLAV
jgi:alanine dehydrogenase